MSSAITGLWQAVLRYLRTPLLPRETKMERIRLLALIAAATGVAIALVHAFAPSGLSTLELAVHAATVGAGFVAAFVAVGWAIQMLAPSILERPQVGWLWLISAGGFALGLGLVGQLGDVVPLADVADKAARVHGPAAMLPGFALVWAIWTAFLIHLEILRSYDARFTALAAAQSRRPRQGIGGTRRSVGMGSGKSRHELIVDDIVHVSAEENYCSFHLRDRQVLIRMTLQAAVDVLPAESFIRTHRSHLVNRSHVRRIAREGRRYHVVVDAGGMRVPISRSRLDNVLARLEGLEPAPYN